LLRADRRRRRVEPLMYKKKHVVPVVDSLLKVKAVVVHVNLIIEFFNIKERFQSALFLW
jgi:hypothetical protein